jgi:hypothetical protein
LRVSLGQYGKLCNRNLQKIVAQLIEQGSPSKLESGAPVITWVYLICLIDKIPKWDSQLARQRDKDPEPREALSTLQTRYRLDRVTEAFRQILLSQPAAIPCLRDAAANVALEIELE